jgi:hypothetical protein
MTELHKDVPELLEEGFDVETLKTRATCLTNPEGEQYVFDRSYRNPVGVEVLVLKKWR